MGTTYWKVKIVTPIRVITTTASKARSVVQVAAWALRKHPTATSIKVSP